MGDTPETPADAIKIVARQSPKPWRFIASMGLFGALVALAITSVVPTRLAPLVAAQQPFDDESGRKPRPQGACGLSEERDEGGRCRPVVVLGSRDEEVTFSSSIAHKGLANLKGTLSVPQGPTSRPRAGVVLVGGSGPHDRQGKNPGDLVSRFDPPFELLRDLAAYFVKQGLVVLRYDKRGPKNYPELAAPGMREKFEQRDFESDARDALAYLATRPEVLPGALVIAGHSEGGSIAAHLAPDQPGLAAMVWLAGTADPMTAGPQIDRVAALRIRQADLFGWGALSWQSRTWARCVERLTSAYDPKETCVDRGLEQWALKTMYEYSLDTPAKIAAVKVPAFYVQGGIDQNIRPSTLHDLKAQLAGHDAELHLVAKLNHALVDVIDRPPVPTVSDAVKVRLSRFLTSVPQPQAPQPPPP